MNDRALKLLVAEKQLGEIMHASTSSDRLLRGVVRPDAVPVFLLSELPGVSAAAQLMISEGADPSLHQRFEDIAAKAERLRNKVLNRMRGNIAHTDFELAPDTLRAELLEAADAMESELVTAELMLLNGGADNE